MINKEINQLEQTKKNENGTPGEEIYNKIVINQKNICQVLNYLVIIKRNSMKFIKKFLTEEAEGELQLITN